MNLENSRKLMVLSSQHITNINRALKNIKLEVLTNYIRNNNKDLTIVTNKVVSTLDLDTIKKYIKNTNVVKSKDTNILIFADVIEKVIQSTYIFNKIILDLKLRIN